VTVTRDAASGKSQQLGSVEIYVPNAFTIQSVSHISNANWTGGVSAQTVRVGAKTGNNKLDGANGRISVTFDINVTSTPKRRSASALLLFFVLSLLALAPVAD